MSILSEEKDQDEITQFNLDWNEFIYSYTDDRGLELSDIEIERMKDAFRNGWNCCESELKPSAPRKWKSQKLGVSKNGNCIQLNEK